VIDLNDHIERKKLVLQIQSDIDAFCKVEFTEDNRTHLGASIIGNECQAYSWNTFRWLNQEKFSGQLLRLFNRGHTEEARFIRWLEGIGFTVWETDPETKAQFRISGVNGHFGGSLDSIMRPPARYNLPDLAWLGEFKTHNEKSFTKLAGKKSNTSIPRIGGEGVRLSKPVHWRQMCSYGRAYNFTHGLYCAVNKDTDELYFEIVTIDYHEADDLFRKAESIINSQRQPPKIAQSEAFFNCKYCHAFKDICHKGQLPTKNCRSCVNARPIENAEWFCDRWNNTIPKDYIKTGCDEWKAIINGI